MNIPVGTVSRSTRGSTSPSCRNVVGGWRSVSIAVCIRLNNAMRLTIFGKGSSSTVSNARRSWSRRFASKTCWTRSAAEESSTDAAKPNVTRWGRSCTIPCQDGKRSAFYPICSRILLSSVRLTRRGGSHLLCFGPITGRMSERERHEYNSAFVRNVRLHSEEASGHLNLSTIEAERELRGSPNKGSRCGRQKEN